MRLTSVERRMYKLLASMNIPFEKYVHMPVGKYRIDFAIPTLKLAIECDGWPQVRDHSKRDVTLSRDGWTILRFLEVDLKEGLPDVRETIMKAIKNLTPQPIVETMMDRFDDEENHEEKDKQEAQNSGQD